MSDAPAVRVAEAAKRLGCSPGTVRAMIASGKLKAFRLMRDYRILAESLDAACQPIETLAPSAGSPAETPGTSTTPPDRSVVALRVARIVQRQRQSHQDK
jgi:excisionase family DNA binding protein